MAGSAQRCGILDRVWAALGLRDGETFRTSVSSSMARASSTRARSSRSCGGMQHSTLGERGMHHRPLHAFPILDVALAYDNDIERHP